MAICAAMTAALAGCVGDPLAPLIPLPQRQATVLPSEAPERGPDGFANVLADPATVAGLPRPPREIAAQERALAAEGARAESETAAISTTSSAAALAARGRSHVAQTRAAIEAQARPRTAAAAALPPPSAPALPAAPPAPAEPLDPNAPLPRAVGVPPFTGPVEQEP